jgi:hypothetical protein
MKTEKTKPLKLIQRLKDFVSFLERKRIIHVHQSINQFYYMEKIAELSALLEQFDDAQRRLEAVSEKLDAKYFQAFHQWRDDFLWIHRCEKCNSE